MEASLETQEREEDFHQYQKLWPPSLPLAAHWPEMVTRPYPMAGGLASAGFRVLGKGTSIWGVGGHW